MAVTLSDLHLFTENYFFKVGYTEQGCVVDYVVRRYCGCISCIFVPAVLILLFCVIV